MSDAVAHKSHVEKVDKAGSASGGDNLDEYRSGAHKTHHSGKNVQHSHEGDRSSHGHHRRNQAGEDFSGSHKPEDGGDNFAQYRFGGDRVPSAAKDKPGDVPPGRSSVPVAGADKPAIPTSGGVLKDGRVVDPAKMQTDIDTARRQLSYQFGGLNFLVGRLRESAFEERAQKERLPPQQILDTYNSLNRLINNPDGLLKKEDRTALAQEFLRHTADPTTVDQGNFETCVAASFEHILSQSNPAELANLVEQAASKGSWIAPDGRVVDVKNTGALQHEPESYFNHQGQRDYVEQLEDNVLLNDMKGRKGITYKQLHGSEFDAKTKIGDNDNGERNFDSQNNVQRLADGRLANGASRDESTGEAKRLGITALEREDHGYVRDAQTQYDSPESFKKLLTSSKLPATLSIDDKADVFAKAIGSVGTGDSNYFSNHSITVDKYDPATNTATIYSWGRSATISGDDLFSVTRRAYDPTEPMHVIAYGGGN